MSCKFGALAPVTMNSIVPGAVGVESAGSATADLCQTQAVGTFVTAGVC